MVLLVAQVHAFKVAVALRVIALALFVAVHGGWLLALGKTLIILGLAPTPALLLQDSPHVLGWWDSEPDSRHQNRVFSPRRTGKVHRRLQPRPFVLDPRWTIKGETSFLRRPSFELATSW